MFDGAGRASRGATTLGEFAQHLWLQTAIAKDRPIALLKKRVEFPEQREKNLKLAVEASFGNPMQLLLMEAEVLEAEIALARESVLR